MSDTKDPKDPKHPNDPEAGAASVPGGGEQSPEGKRSGRVTFDSRGNSVWEWQLETGVYSRDINTQKLKKLDLGDLSIAETAIQPDPLKLEDDPKSTRGGEFNPYNSAPRSKQQGSNPYDNARNLSTKIGPKSEPERKMRSLDELRKLSEVIKAQRNKNKDKG